ncbi:hypothetical protein Tco_0681125 [Tanacetum coccineum]|uniref:RNA-directed DNA polymerase, eukaryota, reverse transcriptase zinc-binding domain protein n=1 Tax=Tanacetum coccineum TaxID=301880 RepID=A0ABQ4XNE0_9ASTR
MDGEGVSLGCEIYVGWAIEGDENSKYFHGIINKKRSNLAIRGVFVDVRLPDLERPWCLMNEIRLAVWDCGVISPGRTGFTFEFLFRILGSFDLSVCKAVDEVVFKGIQFTGSLALSHLILCGCVLKVMESIRSNFFKGASMLEKKISWIAWDKVLASKKKGGLGVSTVHGDKIDSHSVRKVSIWSSILKEVQVLKSSGFDFLSYCSKRIGDGQSTSFWKETWMGDIPLCELCPRLFALDSAPNICVAAKMAGPMDTSGEFSVKDTRLAIDDLVLPSHSEPTRMCFCIVLTVGGRSMSDWRRSQNRTSGSLSSPPHSSSGFS